MILADIEIARGEIEPAASRLARVRREASNEISKAIAMLGLALCGDPRPASFWRSLRLVLPDERRAVDPTDLAFGEPRVLWLLTI